MARILCAWSPNWAIDNWRRRNPPPPSANPSEANPGAGAPETPLALVETAGGVRRLTGVDAIAAGLGLRPGQKAADALALVPGLRIAPSEPEADAQALLALADWCVRFSPAVAPEPPDGLFLDISGVAHLWGDEAALLADFRARLAAAGLGVRAAIADTPGAAWALAHFAASPETLAPPGDQAGPIARLPPAALRLEPQAAVQMERLGLRTVGQLIDLPRAPLARRFGQAALTRLDQALGRAEEALAFRRPPTPWFARLAFVEPISLPEDLARVARDISAVLCARLEAQGQGARRFQLTFHRLDGEAFPLTVGLSVPARDPVRLARLFAPRLESVDPGFGVEVATLTADGVEPISGRQARLDAGREASREEGLAPLVDRLANRLGEGRVWKSLPVESHVPEQAARAAAPLSAWGAGAWDPEQPRPLRLFRRPEPVEAVIALTPDDPPSQFRWRGRLHRVRRAEGPERIGEEWWRRPIDETSPQRIRDYYRLEDEAGARFWLFRAGLYEAGVPARWWLHGLFG